MNNFSWIKSLYQQGPIQPHPIVRKLASLVPLGFGLYFYFISGLVAPLAVSLILLGFFANDRLSHPVVLFIGSSIFFLLHSLTLFCLTLIYYLLLTPLALLKRITQKEDLFFMRPGQSTIRVCDSKRQIQFERQF